MNSRQKEVINASLNDEKAVLKELEKNYTVALADVKRNIRELQSNPLTQSKAYQLEFQQQLERQISGALDNLQGKNYTSVSEYLQKSYETGFIGTAYDWQGQGVPLVIPMDERKILKAVQKTGDDFKLSNKRGISTNELKKQVKSELQRGFASQLSYAEIARNISDYGLADMRRAMTIARTEGHRVQSEARIDAMMTAKEKGADVVKQWDSTLDGNTRPEHAELDGQIVEIDEDFTVGSYSAPAPGLFGDPYMDCNCRCCMLQRARWALDKDELSELQGRASFYGLDKTDDFQDFKEKYLNITDDSDIIRLDNVSAREKYIELVSHIKDDIEPNLPIDIQSKQAFMKRNVIRMQIREQMSDVKMREKLNKEKPSLSYEELVTSKMKRKGFTRQEAIEDIFKTSTKTNDDVNKELGIGGD